MSTQAAEHAGDTTDPFADVRVGNQGFVSAFTTESLSGFARRGLAIVTCMDSRIDPLNVVGMAPGDVKILRNAGARVTDDVLRTLIVATHLLGVSRVLVMPHTDCRMARDDEAQIHAAIFASSGIDTSGVAIQMVADQLDTLRRDLNRIRSYGLLARGLVAEGAIYNVATGELDFIN